MFKKVFIFLTLLFSTEGMLSQNKGGIKFGFTIPSTEMIIINRQVYHRFLPGPNRLELEEKVGNFLLKIVGLSCLIESGNRYFNPRFDLFEITAIFYDGGFIATSIVGFEIHYFSKGDFSSYVFFNSIAFHKSKDPFDFYPLIGIGVGFTTGKWFYEFIAGLPIKKEKFITHESPGAVEYSVPEYLVRFKIGIRWKVLNFKN